MEIQRNLILKHLLGGNRITANNAVRDFGAHRLAAIVHYWRSQGQQIKTELITVKSRYGPVTVARYYI